MSHPAEKTPAVPGQAVFGPEWRKRYEPLGSVWTGDDAELLDELLRLYPRKAPKSILDSTVNGGRFWRGSNRARGWAGY